MADQIRLNWYYRQPEIPGDVPIPSQLLPVNPSRMEALTILAQENHTIGISSKTYTFRDESAEFQCHAYLDSDEPIEREVIFIQSN